MSIEDFIIAVFCVIDDALKKMFSNRKREYFNNKKLYLQTSLRDNMQDDRPQHFVRWMNSTRWLIETVVGQLTEKFHIENVWVFPKEKFTHRVKVLKSDRKTLSTKCCCE